MIQVRVGTAGWTIPRDVTEEFPAEGTSLERYASRFHVAEINSSFHRPHRISTWERWRDSVPEDFRFSVKVPKTITHQAKLVGCGDLIGGFLEQAHVLGDRLAVLLVQLPPKLEFDAQVASLFFDALSSRSAASIACEPRNPSWFSDDAEEMLRQVRVSRVATDPAICDSAARPGGWRGLDYWRLHGSPQMYRSSYADRIGIIATELRQHSADDTWCIFDNTASSAAAGDALALIQRLEASRSG